MDKQDLKDLIKEAKSCAKSKDWNGTLKAARTVLRYEDNNYMALVLEGVALHEIGKTAQSLESYKKATKIKPDDLLGWQGIAHYYEKRGDKKHADLLEAYQRMSQIFQKDSNSTKYTETVLKHAGVLQSQGEFSECIKVLEGCVKSSGHFDKIDKMVVEVIGQIKTELTKAQEELYSSCLWALHESGIATDENYRNLFKYTYKSNEFEKLKKVCLSLNSKFNVFYYPIEYLCRLYLERHISMDDNEMELLVDKLFKLYPSSHFGYFAKGKIFYEKKRYPEAIGWLKEGIESKIHDEALKLLVQSLLKIWDFTSAEEYCLLAKKKLKPSSQYNEFYCLSLAGQAKWDGAKVAIESLKNSSLANKIRAEMYISEEDWHSFDLIIEKLEYSWESEYFKSFKDCEKLSELCQNNMDNLDCLLKCGIQLYQLGTYEKSIFPLEQCLKISQNHPIALFYIGKLCKLEANLVGAKRCLVKAYQALPTSEIGSCLSDLYFEQNDIESNKKLLLSATKHNKKSRSRWAWIRLGVLQLHLGDADQAVVALQSAIRTASTDCHILESLADAYYNRGSYEAALGAYEQCIKYGADPIYPRLKIGVIKRHLGLDQQAIDALIELGDYVPALVERAKTWLQIVKKKIGARLDEAAIEAISEGLAVSSRALSIDIKQQILPLKLISHLILSACQLNPQSEFKIPSYLLSGDSTLCATEIVNLKSLILVGIRVVVTALSKSTSKMLGSSLHADLGKFYYYLATKCNINCTEKAVYHGKKCVSLSPEDHTNWNSLAVFAFAANDIELAQHCSSKSLHLNNAGNPIAWCNLGLVYLSTGDLTDCYKAHKCFVEAQSGEPGYGRTWIGMGLVAEHLNPREAMDLFRHAFTFSDTHEFSIFAYSEWLCKQLQDEYNLQPFDYKSAHSEEINIVPDSIWQFNIRSPCAASLNVQGVIQLHASRDSSAIESFKSALMKTQDPEELEVINQNLLIAQLKAKDYTSVLKLVESLPSQTFESLTAASLASDKLSSYDSAYAFYGQALNLCLKNPIQTSDTLIGQGIMACKLGANEEAKTLLFKGCQTNPLYPNSEGYLVLCAFALLVGENELAMGVLSEMALKCKNERNIHDIALMEACCLIPQVQEPAPLRSILSKIHSYPFNGKLRKVLSLHLMNFHADGIGARRHLLHATSFKERNELSAVAFTYLMEGDYDTAVKYSKRSLRMNLGDPASYAVLLASLIARSAATGSLEDSYLSYKIRSIALTSGRCGEFPRIHEWFETVVIV